VVCALAYRFHRSGRAPLAGETGHADNFSSGGSFRTSHATRGSVAGGGLAAARAVRAAPARSFPSFRRFRSGGLGIFPTTRFWFGRRWVSPLLRFCSISGSAWDSRRSARRRASEMIRRDSALLYARKSVERADSPLDVWVPVNPVKSVNP